MSHLSSDPNAEYVTYFLLSACGGFIKVGTTRNLEKRFKEIRGEGRYYYWKRDMVCEGLRVIGYLPGSIDVERSIQRKFNHLQFRNSRRRSRLSEWFYAKSELVEFVMTQTIPFTDFASVRGIQNPEGVSLKEMIARADSIEWQQPTPPTASANAAANAA